MRAAPNQLLALTWLPWSVLNKPPAPCLCYRLERLRLLGGHEDARAARLGRSAVLARQQLLVELYWWLKGAAGSAFGPRPRRAAALLLSVAVGALCCLWIHANGSEEAIGDHIAHHVVPNSISVTQTIPITGKEGAGGCNVRPNSIAVGGNGELVVTDNGAFRACNCPPSVAPAVFCGLACNRCIAAQ